MNLSNVPKTTLEARHDLIRQLFEEKPLTGGKWPASPAVFMKDDQSLYAIPMPVLNAIASLTDEVRLMLPVELQREREFATYCSDQKLLGYSANGPIVFPLLLPFEKKPSHIQANRWAELIAWTREHHAPNLQINLPASIGGFRMGQNTLSALRHQQFAFLGWLLTNPQFQHEKEALREQWIHAGSNPACLAGRNHLKQRHKLPAQAMYSWGLHSDLGDTFLGFYRRWELDGFATWDLPIQQPANIGGGGDLGQLMELNLKPAIQMPSSMRFPTTLHAQHFLNDSTLDHMHEWQDILKRQRTKRYAAGFVIHFYQETVLRGILGDRLHRRQQFLDQLVADAFQEDAPFDLMTGINVETVKDTRQRYRKLLHTPQVS